MEAKKGIKNMKFPLILEVLICIFILLEIIAFFKRKDSVYGNESEQQNPLEGKLVKFVEDDNDKENADGVKGHLVAVGESRSLRCFYISFVKRFFDLSLSFFGLILLSPIFIVLIIALEIDNPGPVFFTQKRVGMNKRYFKLHKFRSMKMSTPHDVPTHMLEDPEQYITRVGKFIR